MDSVKIFGTKMDVVHVILIIVLISAIVYFAKGYFSEGFSTDLSFFSPAELSKSMKIDTLFDQSAGGNATSLNLTQAAITNAADAQKKVTVKGEECGNLAPVVTAPLDQGAINPEDLLPQTPTGAPGATDSLLANSFLTSGFSIGVDSQNGALKNASLDLRSAPIIPQNQAVSPWSVSSYTPDLMRRPLE